MIIILGKCNLTILLKHLDERSDNTPMNNQQGICFSFSLISSFFFEFEVVLFLASFMLYRRGLTRKKETNENKQNSGTVSCLLVKYLYIFCIICILFVLFVYYLYDRALLCMVSCTSRPSGYKTPSCSLRSACASVDSCVCVHHPWHHLAHPRRRGTTSRSLSMRTPMEQLLRPPRSPLPLFLSARGVSSLFWIPSS